MEKHLRKLDERDEREGVGSGKREVETDVCLSVCLIGSLD